jgi:flagellar motility protein MotE (MotC chaperone)
VGILSNFVEEADNFVSNPGKKLEGYASDIKGAVTGQSKVTNKTTERTAEKMRDVKKKMIAEDNENASTAIEDIKSKLDKIASQRDIFSPLVYGKIYNPGANAEVESLLKIYEGRKSEIAARRAQPGLSQTRLG